MLFHVFTTFPGTFLLAWLAACARTYLCWAIGALVAAAATGCMVDPSLLHVRFWDSRNAFGVLTVPTNVQIMRCPGHSLPANPLFGGDFALL